MSSHIQTTPSPWNTQAGTPGCQVEWVEESGIPGLAFHTENPDADRRLACAAPGLYAVAEATEHILEGFLDDELPSRDAVRALLHQIGWALEVAISDPVCACGGEGICLTGERGRNVWLCEDCFSRAIAGWDGL